MVGSLRDITDQKAVEEQLRETEKLSAIGQLAGGIAHDFNNMLTPVTGYADLIKGEAQGNPLIERYAEVILSSAARAAELTQQLLAFARQGGHRSEPVDVHQVVAGTLALLGRSIGKRVTLRQSLDARPSMATGDASQFQSALLNLALNARDAMPDGGEILFATRVVALDPPAAAATSPPVAAGRYLEVKVADTGVGMEPQTRQAHFRAVLHHQEGRRRHRHGPGRRVRHRPQTPRLHQGQQRAGPGQRLRPRPAAERDRHARARRPGPRRRRPPPAGTSWWSTTTRWCATCWRNCSAASATGSPAARTATRRSRSTGAPGARSTSWCWTW